MTQAVTPDIIPASSGTVAGVGKKKRKTKPAAETNDVPAQTTAQLNSAPQSEVPKATEGSISTSSSPLLDLVHKRLRNVTKKIVHFATFSLFIFSSSLPLSNASGSITQSHLSHSTQISARPSRLYLTSKQSRRSWTNSRKLSRYVLLDPLLTHSSQHITPYVSPLKLRPSEHMH